MRAVSVLYTLVSFADVHARFMVARQATQLYCAAVRVWPPVWDGVVVNEWVPCSCVPHSAHNISSLLSADVGQNAKYVSSSADGKRDDSHQLGK